MAERHPALRPDPEQANALLADLDDRLADAPTGQLEAICRTFPGTLDGLLDPLVALCGEHLRARRAWARAMNREVVGGRVEGGGFGYQPGDRWDRG